jgi:DNA/RNA endonuclease YhcR with UshA esterase domain
VRTLKILTVLLAVSSTIAFVLASRATARPLTAISSITPSMNYAYVRIEGRIPNFPTVSDDAIAFNVLDASGDIRVTAYRTVADVLQREQRIPMPGDVVTVEGTLRIRDDVPSLVLNTTEALHIQSTEATSIRLSALDTTSVGERVQVIGQVRRVRTVSEGLMIATLRAGNATADMPLPLSLPMFATAPSLQEGEWISVTGGVGDFRDARQLLPLGTAAIERSAPPVDAFDIRPIRALDKTFVGQWVAVTGQVVDLRPFSQGMRLLVEDEDAAQLTIVVFERVWDSLPISTTLAVGDVVRVQGEVQDYRGELEILPEIAVDVTHVE